MKARHAVLVALAAAVTLSSVAAAGPDAAKQWVGITIKTVPPFARGKVSRAVEGVRFSFVVPRTGWENGPHERVGGKLRTRSLLISKSLVGGQAAEAVVFWTGFRNRSQAAPCTELLGPVMDRSTADVAAAVAMAPGTKLIKGPTSVTVGGRPAWHVVLTVREDLGCEPGYFFTWRPRNVCWGACWLAQSSVGDTIRVWIVDVRGTRLFIESEMRQRHAVTKEPVPSAELKKVEQEITEIVRSIRFD